MPRFPFHPRLRAFSTLCLCAAFVVTVSVAARRGSTRGTDSLLLPNPDKGVVNPAGTITVNSLSDVANGVDGLCTLREAIAAANADTPSGVTPGECGAGSGDDTLSFSVTGTINLTSALPDLSSNILINGPGANLLTVQRSTAGGTPLFRIFNVTVPSPGIVSFVGLTIANGALAAGGGGGIRNSSGVNGGNSPTVNENANFITITVTRSGNTSIPVTVDYLTEGRSLAPCRYYNGAASPACDYTTAIGTLKFAAGDTSKTFDVLLSQDIYPEGDETFDVILTALAGNATFGAPKRATVTIFNVANQGPTNPIDDVQYFVRQHYHDFLDREPDPAGLAFWMNQINSCGNNAQCIEARRIDVSASFFLSIEFQQSGYLVERFYKTAYGDVPKISTFGSIHLVPVPVVRFNEFLKDTQRLLQGVMVLQPGWEQALETNKQFYALEFVQTDRFIDAYPAVLTPAEFVDRLDFFAGSVLSPGERTTAINLFGGAGNSSNNIARAQALRQVADDADLVNREFNRAFVLAEYFGYLRRNPNEDPEPMLDYTGYDFWLTKLNQFNGNYNNAEMVKAFLSSAEYRQRFGP